MARSITQGDRAAVFTLDVIPNRFRSWDDTTAGVTVTKRHHYADDGDSPAWTDEGNSNFTRTVVGVDGPVGVFGNAAGMVWQITNIHGDVVADVHQSSVGLTSTSEYTEYGGPRDSANAGTRRYGWLGADQRAADVPSGNILMGARLYNPATGRFLQVDPVYGGNANDYDYCSGDAITCSDPSGLDLTCGLWCVTDSWLFYNTLPRFLYERTRYGHDSRLIWSSDGCSSSPDSPLGLPFWKACYRHDFGYRNYKRQGRFTEYNRGRIDTNFRYDIIRYICNPLPWYSWKLDDCYNLAWIYYWGVRRFGNW